ncbi:dynein axonemal assembly factor 8 [Pempheris klunzingeri]|uniref:dynein axonemal assembly factor 8 n=1 Tax=Pempheris klunzingeri TaxID=3127111 RepID=UPI0039808785
MDPSHPSCWESILEKVKPLLPTIDFDSPSLEDEEIISIYQRPAGLSLKIPEDFDSFPLDDDELEADACERDSAVDASVKPNVDSSKSDEGFPVLSFARLDQWDLDVVLQNLKEDGRPLQQCVPSEPEKTHAGGDKHRSHERIMEKLVALCKSQSSEAVKNPNHIKDTNMWNISSERTAAELQLSHQECPTVYIDLRCPDPSIKTPRTSPNPSSEPKSPAKHNTHWEAPPAKKPNLKVHTGSRVGNREATGKSMLLQKMREMNKNGNKHPNKSTDPPHSVQDNGKQSKVKEQKQQSNQQRRPEKQTLQHKLKILKQLEIHRPTKSVNLKQPAAERTDVLFDFDVFHLQSLGTLPAADINSKGCVLLTVDLSSPGMVGDRAHGRRRHLYPAATRAHVYNTLVAWFLSLVGPDPRTDDDEDGAKVPFWVAGLQQLWTEGGLALHVLAVARHCYPPKKRDKDIHAPFCNHICRFLSETSLALVTHWLPQLKHLLDQEACAWPVHLPSSCLNTFISATSDTKVIDRTFGLSPGFYWQTVETRERVCKGIDTTQEVHTEVSVALGCKAFFLHPVMTHYTLQLVLDSGLDVCGLRLLYPPQRFPSESAGAAPVIQTPDEACQPVLALAVRGPNAHSLLKDITCSLDPLLPRNTDPAFLNPLDGSGQVPKFFYSPELAGQVHRKLCFWFSGRRQGGSAHNHYWPLNRDVPADDGIEGSPFDLSRPASFLCATMKADLLLVVSPVVPPWCYGQVLAVCERRGFRLRGLQRLQLQSNEAAMLGLTDLQARVFCSPHTVTLNQKELPSHCLLLLLSKENAMRHSVCLPAALMRELKAQTPLGCVHSRLDGSDTEEPSFCFHTLPYSSNLFLFVRCMWEVPDPSAVILSRQKCSSNSDKEQLVILTLCGKDMSQGLSLLHRVLTQGPEGFQLLGLKSLPALTRLQAQELSPYEVGEQLSHDSLDNLMSSPALVCALSRVNAFLSLRRLLPHGYPGNHSVLMSPTPEVASRQASLFFFEHEMTPDRSVRPLLERLPQICGTNDPQRLLTVCLFKPRTWNHTLAKTVRKLQLRGLTLVGLRVVTLDRSDATSLLHADSDPSDSEVHLEYLCSGSSLALCFEGENAVRKLLHELSREDSSLWTTCCGTAHSFHGIYGSGSYQKAIQDVKRLFPEGLCTASKVRQEQTLSMCSDPPASAEREQSCMPTAVAQKRPSPSMASQPNEGSLIHSAHWQTTCLLIPLNAPPLSHVPSQLDMLEQLLRSGCHLVAGRMSTLDSQQRKHVADIVPSGINDKMAHLYTTPCLIMALQGERIVTCFTSILESIYKERSDLEEVGEMIIYPASEKEAEQLVCYLFDALSPESCTKVKLHH